MSFGGYRSWGLKHGPLGASSVSVTVAQVRLWDSSNAGRTPNERTKTITINPPSAGTIYIGATGVTSAAYEWAISSTSSAVVFDCEHLGLANFYAVSDAGGPRTVSIGQLG